MSSEKTPEASAVTDASAQLSRKWEKATFNVHAKPFVPRTKLESAPTSTAGRNLHIDASNANSLVLQSDASNILEQGGRYHKVLAKIKALSIFHSAEQQGVEELAKTIFRCSLENRPWMCSENCVLLVVDLVRHLRVADASKADMLRRAVVTQCQQTFDQREVLEAARLPNTTFLGLLFIHGVVHQKVIDMVLFRLLYDHGRMPKDYEVEMFSKLLLTSGPKITEKKLAWPYLAKFKVTLKEISIAHPNRRIQRLAVETLDAIDNNWEKKACAVNPSAVPSFGEANLHAGADLPTAETLLRLRTQVEYYLSPDVLRCDGFMQSKMDAAGAVPLAVILTCNKVKALTTSMEVLMSALETSDLLVVDCSLGTVRPRRPPPELSPEAAAEWAEKAQKLDEHMKAKHTAYLAQKAHNRQNAEKRAAYLAQKAKNKAERKCRRCDDDDDDDDGYDDDYGYDDTDFDYNFRVTRHDYDDSDDYYDRPRGQLFHDEFGHCHLGVYTSGGWQKL
jgi:hypothetical protein